MKILTEKSEYVILDSTAVFSGSENVSFLEREHNSKEMHLPQIKIMMLFSSTPTMSTFIRIRPGSTGDVSAMLKTNDTAGVDKLVIVAGKELFSSENIKRLKGKHLSYIIPLRRNLSLMPLTRNTFREQFRFYAKLFNKITMRTPNQFMESELAKILYKINFQVLKMIDGKYDVIGVLLILSRIKMYSMGKGEIMSEITEKAKDLVSDLKIDIGMLFKKA